MKLRPLNEFKDELTRVLKVSHPGNIQISIGDKLFLYYAESQESDYDENDTEFMTAMSISLEFYGEHHEVNIIKKNNEIEISFAYGDLSDTLWNMIDDELSDYIQIIWDAIDKWQLN
jgi:hypothetical protein